MLDGVSRLDVRDVPRNLAVSCAHEIECISTQLISYVNRNTAIGMDAEAFLRGNLIRLRDLARVFPTIDSGEAIMANLRETIFG